MKLCKAGRIKTVEQYFNTRFYRQNYDNNKNDLNEKTDHND